MWFCLIFAVSSTIVHTTHLHSNLVDHKQVLPPYHGKIHAGYIDIREGQSIYYVLAESQRRPTDPLVIWFNGGPFCSSLISFFSGIGPFSFKANSTTAVLNKYPWNKKANMLFIQSPIGTGFSQRLYGILNDDIVAEDNLQFLIKFYKTYPNLKHNELYLAGQSYAGIYIPYLASKILDKGDTIPLRGFIMSSACTRYDECRNKSETSHHVLKYLYNRGFLPDQLWDGYMHNCLAKRDEQVCYNITDILAGYRQNLHIDNQNIYDLCYDQGYNGTFPIYPCSDVVGFTKLINDDDFRRVFHARHSNKTFPWNMCQRKSYNLSQNGSFWLYDKLVRAKLKITILSGELDSVVPMTGTKQWLKEYLRKYGRRVVEGWRPWTMDGKPSGNVWKLQNITYVTLAKAGHSVAQTRPKESYFIFEKFLQNIDLPVLDR